MPVPTNTLVKPFDLFELSAPAIAPVTALGCTTDGANEGPDFLGNIFGHYRS